MNFRIRNNSSLMSLIQKVNLGTTFCVLFVVTAMVVFAVLHRTKNEVKIAILSTVKVLSENLIPALEFKDEKSAGDILKSLAVDENFISAVLLTEENKPFSSFGVYEPGIESRLQKMQQEEFSIRGLEFAEYFHAIVSDGSKIGYIYVKFSLEKFKSDIWLFVFLAIVTAIIVLIVSLIFVQPLLSRVTRPMEELVTKIKFISSSGDYSTRLDYKGKAISEMDALSKVFNDMMMEIENRNLKIKEVNDNLEELVEKRTHELRSLQKDALENAHAAGKAEVTTGVLHNIGNVTNSLNISAHQAEETLSQSPLMVVERTLNLLEKNKNRLTEFLHDDEKGRMISSNLIQLTEAVRIFQEDMLRNIDRIQSLNSLIKDAVIAQQGFAKSISYQEQCDIEALIHSALKIAESSSYLKDLNVQVIVNEAYDIKVDKSKFIHIILNMIRNSKDALAGISPDSRRIVIEVGRSPQQNKYIKFTDNGEGIASENMGRIFSHGFTTKTTGHGFGLHHSAIALQEMNGRISVKSAGKNCGAEFTITFEQDSDWQKAN